MPVLTQQPDLNQVLAMPVPALIDRFAIGVEWFDRRMIALKPEQLDMAFLPDAGVGRWPVRVLVGHLADAELAFIFRLRKIFGEENPTLESWDEESFIDRGIYGSEQTPPDRRPNVGAFVATIFTLRKWTAEWLRTLPAEAFERKGLHTVRGEQTFKTVLSYDTWHLEHHAWFLNKKVAKFLGPTPGQ